MDPNYLSSVIKQFEYYKMLAERTIEQVDEPDLFWQYNHESNSIAIIIQHLSGNMLSRWTDFLISDGEKEGRNRDQEFDLSIQDKKQLMASWNAGWDCLFTTLNKLRDDDLSKIIYIRNQGHTVTEAINRQIAHYPYHIGQIVFLGKMLRNEQWKSLSIPKGNSRQYNAQKFALEKGHIHFTEEYLQQLNTGNYQIAHTTMQQEKWFERHFQFGNTQQIFPSILERLSGTSIRLVDKLIGVSEKKLTWSENNSWSIKENIGHLIDLEPLWQGRIEDILSGQTELRYTDLANTPTHTANHNATSIQELLGSFKKCRLDTIQILQTIQPENLLQSALHPRLKIPMNLQDHILFVADHDDHHLATISQLLYKTQ